MPVVCTLIRGVVPGDDCYSFIGALTLPLAQCSWVIKVQSSEGPITGIREALAFQRFSKEQRPSGQSIEELASIFDPYDELWDSDQVDPEVRRAAPFGSSVPLREPPRPVGWSRSESLSRRSMRNYRIWARTDCGAEPTA